MVNKIIKTILRFFFHDDNETEVIHKEKTISLSTQERDIKRKDDALKKIKYLKQNALSDKKEDLIEEHISNAEIKKTIQPKVVSTNNSKRRRSNKQEKYLNEYIQRQEANKNSVFRPKKNIFHDDLDKNYVSKSSLMRRIKTNLFYLEEIITVLHGEAKYKRYYDKLQEMKLQSENFFKIVYRIKEDAPYLKKTLEVILEHTKTIAKLLESKIS